VAAFWDHWRSAAATPVTQPASAAGAADSTDLVWLVGDDGSQASRKAEGYADGHWRAGRGGEAPASVAEAEQPPGCRRCCLVHSPVGSRHSAEDSS
jgi:hypothetical protein